MGVYMLFRPLVYLSLLATIPFCISGVEFQKALPETVELAWDCHQVLIKPNIPEMAAIFIKKAGIKSIKITTVLGYEYVRYCLGGCEGTTLKLMRDIHKLVKRQPGATGQEYDLLIAAYDESLLPVSREMAAAWVPIKGMPELIKELDELGYTQRIATNMGAVDYEDLVKKHPELFKYLKGGLTVDAFEDPVVRKPDAAYYDRYHERYNNDRAKKVIFTDDNKHNIVGANQSEMTGILFKDAQKLREALKGLGIPLK